MFAFGLENGCILSNNDVTSSFLTKNTDNTFAVKPDNNNIIAELALNYTKPGFLAIVDFNTK